MSATPVDRAIDAFVRGDMSFEHLRRVLEGHLGRNPARRVPARTRLDELRDAGRMSPALHRILAEELDRSAFGEVTIAVEDTEAQESEPAPEPEVEPTEPDERPAPARPPGPEAAPPRPVIEPGLVLAGRYVLESILGRGGMSVVFRARDLHMPEGDERARQVAVKVLADEVADRPDARAALAREAAYARKLNHPGLVRVFDADLAGPVPFIVMELLEGERLRSLLVRRYPRPLPESEALAVLRALAEALASLHEAGIVHRDVKPSNVFVTPQGGIRLLDLGLAGKARPHPGDEAPMRARTPAYSSPGVLAGADPTPADDVYALGCVAYEMFAGHHPYGKLPGNEAAAKRSAPERIESLHAARWQALRKSLAFEAATRQPDAGTFLEEFFAPPPPPTPARPWAAGGILAGLVAGLALGWMAPPPAAIVSKVGDLVAWVRPAPPGRPDPAPVPAGRPPAVPDDRGPAEDDGPAGEGARAPAGDGATPDGEVAAGEEAQAADAPEPPPPAAVTRQADAGSPAREPASPPAAAVREGPDRLELPGRFARVGEAASALRVPLPRPAGYEGPLRVQWRTVSGTAVDGDDFAGSDWALLEVPPGTDELVLYVPIVDDALPEADESFFVQIRRAPGGPPADEVTRMQVVIRDDDARR